MPLRNLYDTPTRRVLFRPSITEAMVAVADLTPITNVRLITDFAHMIQRAADYAGWVAIVREQKHVAAQVYDNDHEVIWTGSIGPVMFRAELARLWSTSLPGLGPFSEGIIYPYHGR